MYHCCLFLPGTGVVQAIFAVHGREVVIFADCNESNLRSLVALRNGS